jgi:nitroimidazol reductase NimA-like FMN-containing flavoprotein (pyridoxamine 5'-phosphate oxidase superfamily)
MTTDQTPLDGQQLMEQILRRETIGYLGLCVGDESYVVPLNYTYTPDGRILFHCALEGQKLDMIRANPNVCFAVSRQAIDPTEHYGEECSTPYESVLCWGTARVLDDIEERRQALAEFQVRYATEEEPRDSVSLERAARCGAVEIVVTRMTGRRVHAGDRTVWEWER